MNNHPSNHPLYHSLGNPPNIQLLDTMFGMQQGSDPASAAAAAAGIHKPSLIPPQYAYQEMQLGPPHHAMNLAPQAHAVTTANDLQQPVQLIYADHHQQHQPISYKMPQMQQQQEQQHQLVDEEQHKQKKDIMAEAASKIFEDVGSGVGGGKKQPVPVSQSATPTANPLPTAVKSEPTPGTSSSSSTPAKSKTPSSSNVVRTGGPVTVGGPRGASRQIQRQQILPRLQLLEDEDDGLTCRMCLRSFWYKSQLIDHLKASHSITDPERYEREEREKKMRRIREEQQRQILAKRQRMAAAQGRGGGASSGGLRGGRTASVGAGRLGHSALPKQPAGPRPSFQYRDGAFICDLCKKSFSDGNDMVTHWKSHVKKQRLQGVPGRVPGRRGRPPKMGYDSKTHMSSRGRPITKKSAGRGGRRGKGSRSDKGKPRWTSYLVWSTRRRKEISQEEPDWTFAEVAKNISVEWKEVTQEDKDRFQDEAERMNAAGVRKMPRVREDDGSSDDTSESDPDFDEFDVKPIMLKIKKEGEPDDAPRSTRKRKRPSFFQEFENEENNLDKILDEFEQEQMEEASKPKPEKKVVTPRAPGEQPRRRRKREQTPDEPEEPIELEKTRSGRVRKKTRFYTYMDPDEENEDDDDEDDEDRDEYQPDDSEPEEEPDEEFAEEEEEEDDDEEGKEAGEGGPAAEGGSGEAGGEGGNEAGEGTSSGGVTIIKRKKIALPPKKRGRPKKIMTDAEIEEATQKAMSAKPRVMLDQLDDDDDDDDDDDFDDEDEGKEEGTKKKKEGSAYKVKPTWITEEDEEEEDEDSVRVKNEPSDSAAAASTAAAAEEGEGGSAAKSAAADVNPLDQEEAAAEKATAGDDENPLEQSAKESDPAVVDEPEAAAAAEEEEDEVPSSSEETSNAKDSAVSDEAAAPMEEQDTFDAAAAAAAEANGDDSEKAAAAAGDVVDDLMTSATAQMEEGDDKFKDIIAEGQMDQIFP